MEQAQKRRTLWRVLAPGLLATLLAAWGHAQKVTTVVGGATQEGVPATQAALIFPEYAVVDAQGNLYISDFGSNRVRKVGPSGTITTYAGTGVAGFSGDGGPAVRAQLSAVTGLALDPAGNLYIADQGNARIRRVNRAGIITTIAGTGTPVTSGDTGPALEAGICFPWALAFDRAGNLYVSDSHDNLVRRIDPSGHIITVAGGGLAAASEREGEKALGDGGDAGRATLNTPRGLAVDDDGNLYIADRQNNRVRRVDHSGTISTLARLELPNALALDGQGNLFVSGNSTIHKVDLRTGVVSLYAGSVRGFDGDHHPALQTRFGFHSPAGLTFDGDGNLLAVDSANGRVRRIDARSGVVTTVAGGRSSEGPAGVSTGLLAPVGVALDRSGNLYISESNGHRILEMDSHGNLRTVAGTGINGYAGDGGPATSATLNFPFDVAVSASGDIYIGDEGNSAIRKVSPSGRITTPVHNSAYVIDALALDESGNVYFSDVARCVVRKLDALGRVTVVAGIENSCGFAGDGGPATSAHLNNPLGIATDASGHLYIADYGNNRVRRVDIRRGTIRTVAGNGACRPGGSKKALSASVCRPRGLALDEEGNLFIADAHRVREVRRNGKIRTVAGSSMPWESPPLAGAGRISPMAVAVDAHGNLYISDPASGRVLKIPSQ